VNGPPQVAPFSGRAGFQKEVHVWTARTLQEEDRPLFESWLSPDEAERCRRYLRQGDQDLFLLAHAFLRHPLSRYADVAPNEWRFEKGEHGRPELAGPFLDLALRFNLSHTPGLVALIITNAGDAGIDVENRTSTRNPAQLARQVFSKSEQDSLRGLEKEDLRTRFYEIWTLKDAYIKARGMGLHLPLRQFSFSLDEARKVHIAFDPQMSDLSSHWDFELWEPGANHQGAIAIRVDREHRRSVVFQNGWA
jgi:4'-phosphopantetheinyl transferase